MNITDNPRIQRIYYLSIFDFKARYYDSYFGVMWAFLNPLFKAACYYFVFTVLFKNSIENFALYLYLGLICWMFFTESSRAGMRIFHKKRYLIEDVQVEKIDLHLANLGTVVIGFLFNISVYFILMPFFSIPIGINLVWFPLIIVSLLLFSLSVNIILSLVQTFVKDFIHIWDMITLLWFWMNPIFYGKDVVYEKLPFLNYINPLSAIMINLRNSILFNGPMDIELLCVTLGSSLTLFIISLFILKKYSSRVAEIL